MEWTYKACYDYWRTNSIEWWNMLINRFDDGNATKNADESPKCEKQVSKTGGWCTTVTEEICHRVRKISPRWWRDQVIQQSINIEVPITWIRHGKVHKAANALLKVCSSWNQRPLVREHNWYIQTTKIPSRPVANYSEATPSTDATCVGKRRNTRGCSLNSVVSGYTRLCSRYLKFNREEKGNTNRHENSCRWEYLYRFTYVCAKDPTHSNRADISERNTPYNEPLFPRRYGRWQNSSFEGIAPLFRKQVVEK